MVLSQKELNELEIEINNLINTSIFSDKLGILCMKMTRRILHTKNYINYPKEWKEYVESDVYIKLIKTLSKYNNEKAQESRTKHNQTTSVQKGMYRFAQLIINSAINTSITKLIKEQNRENEYRECSLSDIESSFYF